MLKMSILEGPLVFVDIETTGLSYSRARVIEIAALRVEAGHITDSFSSLVDPQIELPEFISNLTGISGNDLISAPSFYDIANELMAIMDGALFVAHNARFDYGFLKQEFKRLNLKFTPKIMCTVKLSKALYPAARGHKLQDIINRCEISTNTRHRAFDDAKAMMHFVHHAQRSFPVAVIDDAIRQQLKAPSAPRNISSRLLANLPEAPGVYIFKDEAGSPLYIGKSVNIRKRVLSHFSADHIADVEFKISQQLHDIEYIVTGGELEALLLESQLIKDLQPLHNRLLRRRQKLTLARRVDKPGGFIGLTLEDTATINPDDIKNILGVYTTKGRARDFLDSIIKDFNLCPKLMGFEKGAGSCFLYQLKKCSGACIGKETAESYNQRLMIAFDGRRLQDWPYPSPVIIEENNGGEAHRSFVVDKWCIVADVKQEPECEPVVSFREKVFDVDTYKILRSYLLNKPHGLQIRPIKLEQLYNLAFSSA